MKVCFLSALTMSDFGGLDPTLEASLTYADPPLGILSLAAVLCDRGITPQVVNVNKLFVDFLNIDEDMRSFDFLTFVVQHIESLSFDIIGLSTICSSYPLTLRIAQEVKKHYPNIKIILGGPQASVVDIPTMKAFPFVDYVVRGEAEETFPLLLDALLGRNPSIELEKLQGVTFRRGAEIIRNPNVSPILDLDSLPLPAYNLDPSVNEYKSISLEAGRGCPFKCTFCSTSEFFNRKFRFKSPQKIIEQMKLIKDTYGINVIILEHDNFTTDRKKVVEFCEALINCGEKFYWGCSSRTDFVDDELIALMAKSGCRGIFFGIETGSVRLQWLINKKLNLSDAIMRIKCADQHGIKITVSLITGFPTETKDDLRDTINFFTDILRFDNVVPQIGLLAPLAGTPIYAKYKDKLIFDKIFSDMSHQGWRQDPVDLEMIRTNPEVFPNFYSIPMSHMDRNYLKEVRDFTEAMYLWFHWLPLALLQDSGDMLEIFEMWKRWKLNKFNDNMNYLDYDGINVRYYCHQQFVKDFLEFVKTCYNSRWATAKTAISAITDLENFFLNISTDEIESTTESIGVFCLNAFPYKPTDLHIIQLNIDCKNLFECLKNRKSLKQVSVKNVTIAFRNNNPEDKKKIDVRLLSPLSEELLEMCDGNRSVSDIICQSSLLKSHVNGISPERLCFFGLSNLFKQRFIEVSSQPIINK